MSCTPAGASTGMPQAEKMCSLWCATAEDARGLAFELHEGAQPVARGRLARG